MNKNTVKKGFLIGLFSVMFLVMTPQTVNAEVGAMNYARDTKPSMIAIFIASPRELDNNDTITVAFYCVRVDNLSRVPPISANITLSAGEGFVLDKKNLTDTTQISIFYFVKFDAVQVSGEYTITITASVEMEWGVETKTTSKTFTAEYWKDLKDSLDEKANQYNQTTLDINTNALELQDKWSTNGLDYLLIRKYFTQLLFWTTRFQYSYGDSFDFYILNITDLETEGNRTRISFEINEGLKIMDSLGLAYSVTRIETISEYNTFLASSFEGGLLFNLHGSYFPITESTFSQSTYNDIIWKLGASEVWYVDIGTEHKNMIIDTENGVNRQAGFMDYIVESDNETVERQLFSEFKAQSGWFLAEREQLQPSSYNIAGLGQWIKNYLGVPLPDVIALNQTTVLKADETTFSIYGQWGIPISVRYETNGAFINAPFRNASHSVWTAIGTKLYLWDRTTVALTDYLTLVEPLIKNYNISVYNKVYKNRVYMMNNYSERNMAEYIDTIENIHNLRYEVFDFFRDPLEALLNFSLNLATDMSPIITTFTDYMNAFSAGFNSTADTAAQVLIDLLKRDITIDIAQALTIQDSTVENFLGDWGVFNWIRDAIGDIIEFGTGLVGLAVGIAVNWLKNLIIQPVVAAIDRLVLLMKQMVAQFKTILIDFFTVAIDKMEAVFVTLVDELKNFANVIEATLLALADYIVEWIAEARRKIQETVNLVNSFFTMTIATLTGTLNSIRDSLIDITQTMLGSLGFFPELEDTLYKKYKSAMENSGWLAYAVEHLGIDIDQFAQSSAILEPLFETQQAQTGSFITLLTETSPDGYIYLFTSSRGSLADMTTITISLIGVESSIIGAIPTRLATGIYQYKANLTDGKYTAQVNVTGSENSYGGGIINITTPKDVSGNIFVSMELEFPDVVGLGEVFTPVVSLKNRIYRSSECQLGIKIVDNFGIVAIDKVVDVSVSGFDERTIGIACMIPYYMFEGEYDYEVYLIEENGDMSINEGHLTVSVALWFQTVRTLGIVIGIVVALVLCIYLINKYKEKIIKYKPYGKEKKKRVKKKEEKR